MRRGGRVIVFAQTLNESPSEKEGKFWHEFARKGQKKSLNESPSEKEGKFTFSLWVIRLAGPLNESPSEKEGKSLQATL